MKKRLLSLLLALAMCLSLLPVTASAAQADLPDWYFLVAIFKNVDADAKDMDGKAVHITYSMTQEEVDIALANAKKFGESLNQVGVIRAHVDTVVIDLPVTALEESDRGSFLSQLQAGPVLKQSGVKTDQYDHITGVTSLNGLKTNYWGMTSYRNYEGIATFACVDLNGPETARKTFSTSGSWPPGTYIHEFLHTMNSLGKKWNVEFDLHTIEKTKPYTTINDNRKTVHIDIMLNQARGDAGTGVAPIAWQYPPHVLQTMTELNVPSGVTGIGKFAFANNNTLTKVSIPSSVTSIEGSAFQNCTSLTEVTLLPGVTSIGDWAFGCSKTQGSLAKVVIPASVTSIGYAAFWNTGIKDVYYTGTEAQWKAIKIGDFNKALTGATIHYNHLMADVKTDDWFAEPVTWALENGVTNGTGNGKFSPNSYCTVAQILTFLWRANGSPEPAGGNPFSDVKIGDWYADAAAWAYEKGMVSGETLGVNTPCTRAMAVTYMWKAADSPSANSSSFIDVPAGAPYAQAVDWAVEQGVTNGTSATTFAPGSTCTRGEIVTFLYRALAK